MRVLLGTSARRWLWTLAAIGFITIVLFSRCAIAECLSSAAQVRSEHGVASYSTWNYINGKKCWRLGLRIAAPPRFATVGHKRYPRAAAQSRPPRQSPPTGLPGRTAGLIPATGAIAYAEPENIEVALTAAFTCDDNCLRLWQAFQDLETMERLVPYRVRSAAKDAAYTAWLNQH